MSAPDTEAHNPSHPGRFLTAQWRYLAMVNYAVDRALLQPYVPPGTELDSWQGTTYVSMVGFLFLDTRVLGLSIPFHRDFEEVNLRFYVRRRGTEGWQRGVVFIKEIVPKPAIALVARALYGEKYSSMSMGHAIGPGAGGSSTLKVEYTWRFRRRWQRLGLEVSGDPQSMAEGSEEEFIAEHYWGYSIRRFGGTTEYGVEHPRWRVWPATRCWFECDVAELYGPQFVKSLSAAPTSAFLAEGSPVVVRRGRRLAG